METQAYALTDELRQLQKDERMSAQQKAQRAREIAKKETEKLFAGTEVVHNPVKEFVPLKEVKVGQEVCIAELNQLATVLALPDKNGDVLVRAGIIKTKVPLKGLKQPEKLVKEPTAPKTKASNRTFKVGANCMDMLREYQLYQKAERLRVGSMWARTVQVENGKTVQNDLLFTSWDGTPFDLERLTTWFPHFLRAHDLPAVHFHSLRHTYASLMIAAHVPITTVSGHLGHAQTSTTTDIYAGFIRTADAAASDAMEIVFDNIREKSRA